MMEGSESRRKMTRAAGVNSFFTTLSRIFGLVRDMLMANYFGTGFCCSAFVTAFTLPNLLRRLFGEGALASVFVPQFAQVMQEKGREEAYKCASMTLSWLAVILTSITIVVAAVSLAAVPFLDFSPKWRLTALLIAVMMPYCIFICLTALCGAMLNTLGHFSMPALAPVFLNICIITTVWIGAFFCKTGSQAHIFYAAFGVLLGGLAQLALQIPELWKRGYRFKFSIPLDHPFVKKIVTVMMPAVLGTGVAQINIMVDRYLANSVNERGAAVLYNADRLVEFPLGIFGVALAVAALPVLSFAHAQGDKDRFKDALGFSLRHSSFVMIPAMCGLMILGEPIIRLLLEHGEFTAESTSYTAKALFYYTLGLPGFAIVKILVPAFYAAKDTKTPVIIGLAMMVLNLTLNLILMHFMEERGLALATAISTYINITLLLFFLRKKCGPLGLTNVTLSFVKTIFSSLLMSLAIIAALKLLSDHLPQQGTFLTKFLLVVIPIMTGLFVYAISALILKQDEWKELFKAYFRGSKKPKTKSNNK